MQVAIINHHAGSVEIYDIPADVEDIQAYVETELEVSGEDEWITADEILLSDYRK